MKSVQKTLQREKSCPYNDVTATSSRADLLEESEVALVHCRQLRHVLHSRQDQRVEWRAEDTYLHELLEHGTDEIVLMQGIGNTLERDRFTMRRRESGCVGVGRGQERLSDELAQQPVRSLIGCAHP